ncbi:hypothetical protein ABL78_1458 [Leptomonas seymouri]|uniref:Metallo-beta-lactamase domain-containing protein n=1 Tax=Leptomonas seymouri TaxID=5684 RepID=A0A0N1PFX0_LEPSE|nr:hypothetical protein ABL78_1458 [Leptomonas seymouri]|eukprot:KPI89422.1 hypothetical protein ABL78_1458 [Leptomonas seymouri]
MRLTFVGTGVSCAIPVIGHLTSNCACRDAIQHPDGPNRRNNVALLISLPYSKASVSGEKRANEDGSREVEWHHILIDCGKTFRNAYMRVLAPIGVRFVDALLLTHGHADAMHCVEELCGMQTEAARDYKASAPIPPSKQTTDAPCGTDDSVHEIPRALRRIPTYLTHPTLEQIEMVSRELVRSSFHVGLAPTSREMYVRALWEADNATSSYVAETSAFNAPSTVMDLFFLDEKAPQRIYMPIGPFTTQPFFVAAGPEQSAVCTPPSAMAQADEELPFYSFPVEHGPLYISMCFVFGRGISFKSRQREGPSSSLPEGSCVVYISDVSAIPEGSMAFLLDLVKIDILILDLLAEHGTSSASHYCADEAIPIVVKLAPRKTYFVGMFCSLEHHSANKQLAQELTDLKTEVRKALATLSTQNACSPEEALQHAKKRQFLEETVSMELAYDGQQLDIDP